MLTVQTTQFFNDWFTELRDREAKARVEARIERLKLGNFGQHRELKGGVGEMKIDFGPGYRVYYTRRGDVIVVLLCGGTKKSQNADIALASKLAKQV